MPKERYLLCPQCGSHRLFVKDSDRGNVYFHINWEGQPVPTKESAADLTGLDFSLLYCCGCSWSGTRKKLLKYFTG